MASTNKTLNFNLPLFIENDVPSILVDFNSVMENLDSILKNLSDGKEENTSTLNELKTEFNILKNNIKIVENSFNELKDDLKNNVNLTEENQVKITVLNESILLLTNDINELTNSLADYATSESVNSAVNNINVQISSLSGRVNQNTQSVGNLSTQIENISNSLTDYATSESVNSAVNNINVQISSLSGRVNQNMQSIGTLSNTVSQHTTDISELRNLVNTLDWDKLASSTTVSFDRNDFQSIEFPRHSIMCKATVACQNATSIIIPYAIHNTSLSEITFNGNVAQATGGVLNVNYQIFINGVIYNEQHNNADIIFTLHSDEQLTNNDALPTTLNLEIEYFETFSNLS